MKSQVKESKNANKIFIGRKQRNSPPSFVMLLSPLIWIAGQFVSLHGARIRARRRVILTSAPNWPLQVSIFLLPSISISILLLLYPLVFLILPFSFFFVFNNFFRFIFLVFPSLLSSSNAISRFIYFPFFPFRVPSHIIIIVYRRTFFRFLYCFSILTFIIEELISFYLIYIHR